MRRCLLLLFFVLAVSAQDERPVYNFLLIVDSSISMAERKPAVLSTIRDVVRSGFSGQTEAGDVVDVWISNSERNAVRFTTQAWDPSKAGPIAATAAESVRHVKFQRGRHIEPAMQRLSGFLPQTKAAEVVILTDGEEPFSGISLDLEINAELPKLRREASRTKQPIVISMIALDGFLVDWRASVGGREEQLARLPNRPKPFVAEESVSPEPAPEPEPLPEPPPERTIVFNYPPGTRIVPAPPEPAPEVAVTPAQADPGIPKSDIIAVDPPSTESPVTNERINVVREEAPPVQVAQIVASTSSSTQALAVASLGGETRTNPIPPAVAGIATNPPAVASGPTSAISRAAAKADRSSFARYGFIFFLASLGVSCFMVAAILLSRRKSPVDPGSLISQSLSEPAPLPHPAARSLSKPPSLAASSKLAPASNR